MDFTEDFLRFFFLKLHAAIEFSKRPEFLDGELRTIAPDSAEGKRYADRLLKAGLKAGGEQVVYISIEAQDRTSEPPNVFPGRMFVYHYRARDLYGGNVVTCVALTEGHPRHRLAECRHELYGNALVFHFDTVKLTDVDTTSSRGAENPFALATRIRVEHNRAGADPFRILESKLDFTRELLRSGAGIDGILRVHRHVGIPSKLAMAPCARGDNSNLNPKLSPRREGPRRVLRNVQRRAS